MRISEKMQQGWENKYPQASPSGDSYKEVGYEEGESVYSWSPLLGTPSWATPKRRKHQKPTERKKVYH